MSEVQSRVQLLPLGALIQDIKVGPQNISIVQGFETQEQYQKYSNAYFGETIGRVANRISDAKINSLNGKSYPLSANNGPNSLHGGVKGWGKLIFDGPRNVTRNGKPSELFKLVSSDGDEGYPGTVALQVWYTETSATDPSADGPITILEIEYEAELIGDDGVAETAVAVTNHSYFNVGNQTTIEGTSITLGTNKHQPVDETDIPLGQIEAYPRIEADKPFVLGASEPDVDHCFIMDEDAVSIPMDTRDRPLRQLIACSHPNTGIHLEISSTEPAFQFYTGKYIDIPAVDGLPARGPRAGFCVEPSRYINAINDDRWRSMVVLKRGQKFGSKTVYRAWKSSSGLA